jgi:hypothetical protein
MAQFSNTNHLVDALKAEGFPLPENCRHARLLVGVNTAFVMEYECNIADADLAKLGRALERVAEIALRQRMP